MRCDSARNGGADPRLRGCHEDEAANVPATEALGDDVHWPRPQRQFSSAYRQPVSSISQRAPPSGNDLVVEITFSPFVGDRASDRQQSEPSTYCFEIGADRLHVCWLTLHEHQHIELAAMMDAWLQQ